ncbi:hypothetical protein H7U20_05150 [Rugamonas sp. CCM 8940]|nr:hypothetical protein [Rugamonas sp. CCM 8940]
MVAMTSISLLLAACAAPGGSPPPPGSTAEQLQALLGRPSASYRDGADTLLEYATGPSGQATYMARLGADGRLLSYEQVLSSEKFAAVKIGRDNQHSILLTFGQPFARQRYPLNHLEAWLYRYKEQGVWNSIMYVQFRPDGSVDSLQNGPDPEREPHRAR